MFVRELEDFFFYAKNVVGTFINVILDSLSEHPVNLISVLLQTAILKNYSYKYKCCRNVMGMFINVILSEHPENLRRSAYNKKCI